MVSPEVTNTRLSGLADKKIGHMTYATAHPNAHSSLPAHVYTEVVLRFSFECQNSF